MTDANRSERILMLREWLMDLAEGPHGLRDYGTLALETGKARHLIPTDDAGAGAELLVIATLALLGAADALGIVLEPRMVRLLAERLDKAPGHTARLGTKKAPPPD